MFSMFQQKRSQYWYWYLCWRCLQSLGCSAAAADWMGKTRVDHTRSNLGYFSKCYDRKLLWRSSRMPTKLAHRPWKRYVRTGEANRQLVLVKSAAHPRKVWICTAHTPANKTKKPSANTDLRGSLEGNYHKQLTKRQCRPVCRQNRLPCSRDAPTALRSPLGTHPSSFFWRISCCSLFG